MVSYEDRSPSLFPPSGITRIEHTSATKHFYLQLRWRIGHAADGEADVSGLHGDEGQFSAVSQAESHSEGGHQNGPGNFSLLASPGLFS